MVDNSLAAHYNGHIIEGVCRSMEKSKQKITVKDMALIALFTAIIAVCSWTAIPMTIPITLQTFAVFVAAGILGLRRGLMSVVLYILLGAVGVPVFSGFRGGIGFLLGNTGGYIVGFLFTALAVGFAADKWGRKTWVLAPSMVLGLALCYAFGTAWFMFVYARSTGAIGLATALGWCVVPYLIPDAVKIAVAVLITNRLDKALGDKI